MTTSNTSSVLKDVVAYVDVWSSDKTANYSKPFIQQLQEMGAQVSKTFNKQVTHVVFNNGHPATWRKAKKSAVKLVSVLWIGRCYDDGIHVDEELFPALDETNPLLKNKKHRCMQPKDSPERTPENDRRMRKKLDKLMKDLVPKQPLITDVSPIIIDEESGIVYSPALKRSDYMAQRLKDMKQKRENLSPTASQMLESGSPTHLKPSLGSTPTVLKLMYDQSDDDSSASVAEPVHSPDKEEGRAQHDATDHSHIEHGDRVVCEKPWLSPCSDVSKRLFSPLTCPGPSNKDDNERRKSRKSRTLIRKMPSETHNSVDLSENPDCSKNLDEGKIQTQRQSSSLSPKKSLKGKVKASKSIKETKTRRSSDAVNSVSAAASPKLVNTAVKLSNETSVPVENREQKAPKRARPSLSSLIRSFTASDSKSLVSADTDGDDDVFEDYFSPANFRQKSKRPVLPNLPVKTDIVIPFELDSVPNKRKQRRSESTGSESLMQCKSAKKKKKLERSETDKTHSQQSGASSDPQSDKQLDVEEAVTNVKETLLAKRRRQSTLPFTPDVVKTRRSSSALSTMVQDSKTMSVMQKNCDASVTSQTLESRGNECSAAAGLAEISSEGEEIHNKEVSWSLPSMVNKTKAMRTMVMTSMPTEKQHIVDQVVKSLGGFSIVDRVCESTTHVVSGSHRRTLNILLGIARGCWILSFEWILWCLEQRQWVPEEPYELSDHFPAAQICRLQRHLSAGEHQQDLFQRQPAMFVSQHSQPPTQSLVELIQLCGGTVCKSVRQAGICIGRYTGRRPEGSRIVSEQWVLDSITHLKQLSYDNYNLE